MCEIQITLDEGRTWHRAFLYEETSDGRAVVGFHGIIATIPSGQWGLLW